MLPTLLEREILTGCESYLLAGVFLLCQSQAPMILLHAWCQSLSLTDQLNLGIRFFDIRVRHYCDDLFIHHEQFYQNIKFRDCLDTMTSFLRHHQGEIVFMRVKEEYSDTGSRFGEAIKSVVDGYPYFFWDERLENQTKIKIPKVGEARGKIVILQNFNFDGRYIGIDYNDLIISDKWSLNAGGEKWDSVVNNLQKVRGQSSYGKIYLTFNSCATIMSCPRENARVMNTKLHSYVCTNSGPFGIVAIDYPGPKLVSDIIRSN